MLSFAGKKYVGERRAMSESWVMQLQPPFVKQNKKRRVKPITPPDQQQTTSDYARENYDITNAELDRPSCKTKLEFDTVEDEPLVEDTQRQQMERITTLCHYSYLDR